MYEKLTNKLGLDKDFKEILTGSVVTFILKMSGMRDIIVTNRLSDDIEDKIYTRVIFNSDS